MDINALIIKIIAINAMFAYNILIFKMIYNKITYMLIEL